MSSYSAGTKRKVLQKSNSRCFYCGEHLINGFEIDHFLPFSIYKDGTTQNLVATCKYCNRIKSDHSIEEFRSLLEVRYNKKIVFFFEFYGIECFKDYTIYQKTLCLKTFDHNK
jgi:5-methylcytosine-specific restriction endonuclease McrA